VSPLSDAHDVASSRSFRVLARRATMSAGVGKTHVVRRFIERLDEFIETVSDGYPLESTVRVLVA